MERVVVVSGGGTGIGRAIARAQAQIGDRVIILGRRTDVLHAAADDINAELGADHVRAIVCDVGDIDAVLGLHDTLRGDYGSIDAVVNNAGGSADPGSSLAELVDAWRTTYDKNVITAVLLTRALST